MTDNEIIKAWEKVLNNSDEPIGEHWMMFVTTQIAKETFDMLNRQNAEIERLKAEQKMADGYADALVERTKIKARKEFAERLRKVMLTTRKDINGYCHYETEDYYIDNLLKEMESE